MLEELQALNAISERLQTNDIPFMLTGSFALAFYATPRMTRDIDLVVALGEDDIEGIVAILSSEFYVDIDDVRTAVKEERLFNLMHFATSVKIDLIVRKRSEYRRVEFGRRRSVDMNGVKTWIVSREDLILSKLVWARDTRSELQRRDVRMLLEGTVDRVYLKRWADDLDVSSMLEELSS
jgi:predicted nucleotidyltransferase